MDNKIERIQGNHYYEYEKIKNLKVSDNGEKFSLDYRNEQLPANAKDNEEKEESEKEIGQSTLQNGVRLEISNGSRAANAEKTAARTAAKSGNNTATLAEQASSFIESVRSFIASAIDAVKNLFDKIWNEPQPESTVQESGTETEQFLTGENIPTQSVNDLYHNQAETIYESPQDALLSQQRNTVLLDREIRPYLKSGDLDHVIDLLTDNGKKTAARNSTLLTYYDKNGRMVEPNASDRERILHGDRNTRKL